MKTYRGKHEKESGLAIVEVVTDDCAQPLIHQCCHSPDGFEWGYGGSGPADLARSILADVLGRMPSPTLYQAFKFDFVANWSDAWSITEEEVQNWLMQPAERRDDDDYAVGQL